jgi:hypothetical protein
MSREDLVSIFIEICPVGVARRGGGAFSFPGIRE